MHIKDLILQRDQDLFVALHPLAMFCLRLDNYLCENFLISLYLAQPFQPEDFKLTRRFYLLKKNKCLFVQENL